MMAQCSDQGVQSIITEGAPAQSESKHYTGLHLWEWKKNKAVVLSYYHTPLLRITAGSNAGQVPLTLNLQNWVDPIRDSDIKPIPDKRGHLN